MPAESFADLLARHRDRGGWSRREIADAAGLSSQFILYLETGERRPSADSVERLIVAMDLPERSANQLRRAAKS